MVERGFDMKSAMIAGLRKLGKLKTVIFALLLWQLLWSTVLVVIAKPVVDSILYRWPNEDLSGMTSYLYSFEFQFLLMNGGLTQAVMGTLLSLLAIRYLFSPLIEAGLYYSLYRAGGGSISPFLSGIRRYAKAFYAMHAIQWLFIFIPLLFLWGDWSESWHNGYRIDSFLIEHQSSILSFIVYFLFIKLWLTWAQLTLISESELPLWKAYTVSLWYLVRRFYLWFMIGIIYLLLSTLLMGALEGIALLVTGTALLLIQQLSLFSRTICKVWLIGSWVSLLSQRE
jgi:hypothetical protein